jgi:DNA adenine methylase
VLSSQCFGSALGNSWASDKKKRSFTKKIENKKGAFTEELTCRLQRCTLESADACYVINSRNVADAFFYCDPPYYNANMGHYDGYSLNDFKDLLDTLSQVKGKFLLSSYPSDVLTEYTTKFGWNTKTFDMYVSAAYSATTGKINKRKTEVLTANYEI